MAKIKKYHTIYNWTYALYPSDPKDPSTINATWVPMDAQITLKRTVGDKVLEKKFYFNLILQLASDSGKYFVMTLTMDNTAVDGTAYQYYGKQGKIPIIQSVRTLIDVSDSGDAAYLTQSV